MRRNEPFELGRVFPRDFLGFPEVYHSSQALRKASRNPPLSVLTLPIPKVWTVRFIPDMRHSLSIDSVEALRESSAYNG
jgi:hypothetical protein